MLILRNFILLSDAGDQYCILMRYDVTCENLTRAKRNAFPEQWCYRRRWMKMKKLLGKGILLVVCFVVMLFSSTVACFAHWMPESETYVGGVGPGCTLSYVKSIYGEPDHKSWFNSDGVRGVTYEYGSKFRITGRTGSNDSRAEDDLIVCGYDLKANNLATPSGITVGVPYKTVAGMYGSGAQLKSGGKVGYSYDFSDMREMSLYVNSDGIIVEIYVGTDF